MIEKVELFDDGIGAVEYIQHMGSDLTIVNAARVSFGKEKKEIDEADKKLITYLMGHNHTSTLEHNTVTFRFIVPLFIRSQHHRHRTWSYNEISRRYTNINLRFYEPKKFRKQSESNRQASVDEWFNPEFEVVGHGVCASDLVKQQHDSSLYAYNKLLELGICREQARGVLPQNLYTEYYGTVNLHNLLKFIKLRSHDGAQWEIQQVANACLSIAQSLWPIAITSFRGE